MSKKKAGGKTGQHIRPSGKRLGVKTGDGEKVIAGQVLIRQTGRKIGIGKGTAMGRDFTVFSVAKGTVKYATRKGKKIVSVI